jgi:hypothetical protein
VLAAGAGGTIDVDTHILFRQCRSRWTGRSPDRSSRLRMTCDAGHWNRRGKCAPAGGRPLRS